MRFVLFILLALGTGAALYFGLTAPLVAPKHKTFDTSAGEVAVKFIEADRPVDKPFFL